MQATGAKATSHDFHLPTHRLRYLTWGEAHRPAIVLIHGGLDNAETWEDLAGRLSRAFHVFALDLRGHGDSDWSSTGDYLPASYLGDMARFLKDVPGWPARVVGHSMGARLSLQLMGALPEAVSHLVAIEGLGAESGAPENIDGKMRDWIASRTRRAQGTSAEKLGEWLRARISSERKIIVHPDLEGRIAKQLADAKKRLTREQAEQFVRTNMRKVDGGWAWKFDPLTRWQNGNEEILPQDPYWRAIRGPVLHLYGAQSWLPAPREDVLGAFADGRLTIVPDAGHWVHLNQPEAVARAIEAFLAQASCG